MDCKASYARRIEYDIFSSQKEKKQGTISKRTIEDEDNNYLCQIEYEVYWCRNVEL